MSQIPVVFSSPLINNYQMIISVCYTTTDQEQMKVFYHSYIMGISCLNSYLFWIGTADLDQCIWPKGKETVHHFLFSCPLWDGTSGRNHADSKKRKALGRDLISFRGVVLSGL